ncbi:MAG: pyridoxamine 5'-phosphate oxidase family protein [Thaumarchaeota archaeon]|nr:pyridoxamine 5'-phosphate oxidase family protein [Nitrososphaerota archaeon]
MRAAALTAKEKSVVAAADLGRLATVSKDGWPHVVPVSYVYSDGMFYVPSGEDTVKVGNLKRSPRATIVIDDEEEGCGVMLECDSKVVPAVEAEKWRRYMRDVKGWQNDRRTAVIRLKPVRKSSWFLKG